MIKIHRQYIAILVLAIWLAGCSTVNQTAAPEATRQVPGDSVGSECNAAPDASRTQYIIGYGSLMQDDSRKRTSPQAGPAYPVEIRGYKRGWFARAEAVGFSTTFLGVRPDPENHLNAVIYQVEPAELLATDKREVSYCRAGVAIADVKLLESAFSPASDGQAWIYVNRPETVAIPNAHYPIVRSYVDIFVSGCLEQEQRFGLTEFSRECLATTTDWSEHWVNDRVYPRRPFLFQPKARQIDGLLSRQLPQYFSHIRIESGG